MNTTLGKAMAKVAVTDIARGLGTSRDRVYRLRQGTAALRAAEVPKLAELLGLKVEELTRIVTEDSSTRAAAPVSKAVA